MKTISLYVAVGDEELQAWLDSHGLEDVTFQPGPEAHGSGWMLVTFTMPSLVPFLRAWTAYDSHDEGALIAEVELMQEVTVEAEGLEAQA